MTFTTSTLLGLGNEEFEVDFVAWLQPDQWEARESPALVIGEAKSLGRGDLYHRSDFAKLRSVAKRLPGATIVVAVLRENFTNNEKALLKQFVLWGRRPDKRLQPTNPVVLLTGHELLFDMHVSEKWKSLGEPYSKFADFEVTNDMGRFAEATQAIHLGLPSYYEWLTAKMRRRSKAPRS